MPIERKRISLPIKQNKPQKAENRNLNGEERKALGRFKRAKEERETAFKRGDLTEAERNTVMALSQPGLAFWASKGIAPSTQETAQRLLGSTNSGVLRGIRTLCEPAILLAAIADPVPSWM